MAGHAQIDPDIVLQHAGFIRSLARGLIRDESLVDDVVQETLITALERGPERREALTAWLRTVTRNIAYKAYRSTARRRSREEEAAQPERQQATIDIVAKGEALESLTGAVLELPAPAQEIIFLRYYEELSHAEIGERLGIASGAVRMRVHRAQKLLQERLDRSSDGDRLAWMSGLAGLVGVPLSELRGAAAAETVAAPTATGTLVLVCTALLCVGFGVLVWLGVQPGAGGAEAVVSVARQRALASIDDSSGMVSASDRVTERAAQAAAPFLLRGLSGDAGPPAVEVAEEAPFPPGNLRGTVVNLAGQPVPGARIWAAWGRFPMEQRAVANEHGRFALVVPESALEEALDFRYTILVGATASGSSPSTTLAYPFEGLDPSGDEKRIRIQMRGPGGSLEGTVIGADGRPIRGAKIQLGERRRLGVGFLGQCTAEAENPLAPHLATVAGRSLGSMFQGHRSMRGTLGGQVIEASGRRARLLPASYRVSDANGRFAFDGLEPSRQKLRITADGRAPWTGHVEIVTHQATQQVFPMPVGASVRGSVRRADGLPPTETLVHAILERPFTVQTVRVASDGSYALSQLPSGPVRIVAEERKARRGHTPTRVAISEIELLEGEERSLDILTHPPATARVRVVVENEGARRPLPGMRIEVTARHNPLYKVASIETDETGLAMVPIETVVPCDWSLTQAILRRRTLESDSVLTDTPILFLDAPTAVPSEEIVIRLSPSDLRPSNVLMEPVVPNFRPLELRDGVQLMRADSALTFSGWPTERPGVLTFQGVPPGNYRILYPHHGLGWISPFTVRIESPAAGGTVDLGRVELPVLGELELVAATDDPSTPQWHDVTIQALVNERGGTSEISVFSGRIEVPSRIKFSPGRYRLSGASGSEEITVLPEQTVKRLWP